MNSHNNSELRTTVGDLGDYEYVVNIQKRFNADAQDRLSLAVGVLVGVQYVLSVCSIFYDAVHKQVAPEEKKFKDLRVVADGVNGHQEFTMDGRKIRFIDKVTLHPKCLKPPSGQNKWVSDLAIAGTSFPFDFQKGSVGEMKFGCVPGGAAQLEQSRTNQLMEFYKEHASVDRLGQNSSVCHVMSWGRHEEVTDPDTGAKMIFSASPRLLLYEVKLANNEDCEAFCSEDDRFCGFNKTTYRVICAHRGDVTFVYQRNDYSAYPCAGTEGSPLICHPPGEPEKPDIYGIVATIPPMACLRQKWPITITPIDVVSTFVFDVIGKAATVRATNVIKLYSFMISYQYMFHI